MIRNAGLIASALMARSPRLKKHWGQHHLVDGGLCAPLVRFLDVEDRAVVEVGPGGGVLTRELFAAGARVLAWEIDPEWAFGLDRSIGSQSPKSSPLPTAGSGGPSRSTDSGEAPGVVVGDALEIPWHRLPYGTLVTGNLPYNVGTAIIKSVLEQGERFPRSAFLVQSEVADRLIASVGDSAYASLSVFVAVRARSWRLGRVRPGSFRPPPKVESTFVGFEAIEPLVPVERLPEFDHFLRDAFAHPRKTLSNSLGRSLSSARVVAELEALGFDSRSRPGQIPVDGFVALFDRLIVD